MMEAISNHSRVADDAAARPDAPAVSSATPWWGRPRVLAALWLCLLVYGSLMPFDFAIGQRLAAHGGSVLGLVIGMMTSLGFVDPTLHRPTSSLGLFNTTSDVLLNALLYLPLGLFVRMALRYEGRVHQRHAHRDLWLTLLVLATLSYSVECAQYLMPERWPTVSDWLTNVGGGLAGALAVPWLATHGRSTVFWLYCRTAGLRFRLQDLLHRQRKRPVIMFLAVAVNCSLLVLWYAASLKDQHTAKAALPFLGLFERSYDVAALQLGRSVVVYVLVAMLLSLQFMRQRARRGFSIVVLGVALLAAVLELGHVFGNGVTDLTEPIIGAITAAALGFLLYLLFHAGRCSCRRREQVPVDVDRRRRPHDYGDTRTISWTPRHRGVGVAPDVGSGCPRLRARAGVMTVGHDRDPRPDHTPDHQRTGKQAHQNGTPGPLKRQGPGRALCPGVVNRRPHSQAAVPRPVPHRRLAPRPRCPRPPARARSPYQTRLCSRPRAAGYR